MYGLDNTSGVKTMPALAPVNSATPLWFTEGGAGLAASYPGQDWFNMIQAELLGILTAGGIKPEKGKLNQLSEAIKKIVSSGDFATKTELSDGLEKKLSPNPHLLTGGVDESGNGSVNVANGGLRLYREENGNVLLLSRESADGVSPYKIRFRITKSGTAATLDDIVGATTTQSGTVQLAAQEGQSTSLVMHQKATTDALNKKMNGTEFHSELPPIGHTGAFYAGQKYGYGRGVSVSNGGDTGQIWVDYKNELFCSYRSASDNEKKINHIVGVPIGSSILWNTSAPIPDNFWPNEGRSFSETEYPEAAKAMPSLKLPDDRGYGIRIADNGRGIDAGRQVGTYQEDQIQNITGSFGAPTTEGGNSGKGAFSHTVINGGRQSGAGANSVTFDFDASRVVRAGTETRMKNVAKILITRMK